MMANWLITGVSSGLGTELARAALAANPKDIVCGTVRSEADKARFEAIDPSRAKGFIVDIRDEEAVREAVAKVEAAVGSIDRLINNAAFGMTGALEETSLAEARAMFDVNLFGTAAMIQAVLPGMRARRDGWIVNITSMSGHAPWWGTSWYGATKYALECLGQALAQEVRHLGIRVMNAAPGGMRTDFAGRSLAEAALRIDDYEPSAHEAKRTLASSQGREKGDPVLAAQAIVAAVGRPDAPMVLFLGEDAVRHVRESWEEIRADMDKWEETALSITRPVD